MSPEKLRISRERKWRKKEEEEPVPSNTPQENLGIAGKETAGVTGKRDEI